MLNFFGCLFISLANGMKKKIISDHSCTCAAKSNPFFGVQPNFGPNFWVQTGRVGPQDPKTGPIGSGWHKKGFKFGLLGLSLFPFIFLCDTYLFKKLSHVNRVKLDPFFWLKEIISDKNGSNKSPLISHRDVNQSRTCAVWNLSKFLMGQN